MGATVVCFGPTLPNAATQFAQSQATPQQGRSAATSKVHSVLRPRRSAPGTAIVWVNTRSRIYHAKGTRDYGKTRSAFYMCQSVLATLDIDQCG